jgi:hypothetical protein
MSILARLAYQPVGGHRPAEPEIENTPEGAYFVPDVTELDDPQPGLGVQLNIFPGYVPNRARLNGEDINPMSLQTMHSCYNDGVQLYNGIDGITQKRFGPGQFYVLSDSVPADSPLQTQMVPHGMAKNQVLTASDIQAGPAGVASVQAAAPATLGPVYYGGVLANPGGC